MRITNFLINKVKDFANFPENYVKRSMEQVYWKTPRGRPNYLPKTVERKKFRFTTNRPWTHQFRQQNMPGTIRKKVFSENLDEWSYFRGDRVQVLVGKDEGKQGIVTQVIPERNWVIVEGLNWHYRKVAGNKEYPGVIIKSEAPLSVEKNHISLVDPSDLQATQFEWRYTEEGEKVRVSIRTGRIIPIPLMNEETYQYKSKNAYVVRDKDTTNDVVSEITFEPELKTFEMDIMEKLNIVEDREPQKTYWY